jgi:VanZ family protein
LGLFVIMHIPLPTGPPAVVGGDKGIHFALYFVLTLLGGRCQQTGGRPAPVYSLILWAGIYAVYAAFDEWLQQYTGRVTSLGDFAADVIGVAAGTALLIALRR